MPPCSDARDDYRVNLPWEIVPKNRPSTVVNYREEARWVVAAFSTKALADRVLEVLSDPKLKVRQCPC